MLKIIFVAVFIFIGSLKGIAEERDTRKCKLDNYVGIQVNQLLKQIINLNSNTSAIANPYLITYSIYSHSLGFGLNTGIGYTYDRTLDKESPANHESKSNNLFYRIGIGKRFSFSNKFEGAFSFDFAGDYQINRTFTNSVIFNGSQTDSTSTFSTSKTASSGGGLQLNLFYHFSEKLMLGTEATCYYLHSNIKNNVTDLENIIFTFNPQFNSQSLSASNNSSVKSSFSITIPVVLFFVVKF